MNIIISPVKKMNVREDELDSAGLPHFFPKAGILEEYVRNLSREEVRNMWTCNERTVALNYKRFRNMDLTSRLTPALLSYEEIRYQCMASRVFEQKNWDYVQFHLWILSDFYGILRLLDGIVPYRLEMQAEVTLSPKKEGQKGVTSLCRYWGDLLYRGLVKGDRVIINLVPKEYSKAVEPYLTPGTTCITCVFGNLECDKQGNAEVKAKVMETRMARGEVARFMAENAAGESDRVKVFDRLGYRHSEMLSGERGYVFLKQQGIQMGRKDERSYFIGSFSISGD